MANISALNVINEGLPKINSTNSFSSMDVKGNSVDFLLDLIQSLDGYDELKKNIVDLLTKKLPEIESDIKKHLKVELKEYVSCGINPLVPAWFRSTGAGVNIKLSDIDFFEITKIDPKSPYGFLIYSDYQSGLNSTDFNTFLYSNIEQNKSDFTPNGGTSSPWGSSTIGSDVIDLKFSPVGTPDIGNNVIKVTTNSNFDNKTLIEFNNSFIDSISFFGSPNYFDGTKILNSIIDNLFGTMSSQLGKTIKQLKKEAEINKVLECILNSDENDVIDDNYFTFNNAQLADMEVNVNNRKNGIKILKTCGDMVANIPISLLVDTHNSFTAATSNQNSTISVDEAKVQSISESIDKLAIAQALKAAIVDLSTAAFNFIIDLVKQFTISIINIILTPRLMTLFAVNYKILYGSLSTYDGPIDFMKKNKNLIISISKLILEQIVKMLLILALKRIAKKLAKKYSEDTVEQNKNYIVQIGSLLGVSPKIIKEIQNLDYTDA